MKKLTTSILAASMTVSGLGCATKTQTGALVGGAGGAGVGAAIGSASGNAGKGALIGGAVGAIGGGLIGHGMDKKDERARDERESRSDRRSYDDSRITEDEVVAWSRRGTSDEVIIDRIDRSGTVFKLSSADERYLRDSGVSEGVIRAMRNTAVR